MWSDSIWPRLKLQQHYLHVLSFTKSLSHQDKIKKFDWTVIYSNAMRTNIYKDQTDIHSDHVYFISLFFFNFSLTEKYIGEHKERLQTGAAPELGPSLLSDLLADPQMSTADIQRTLMDVFVGGIDSASTCFSIKGQIRGYTSTVKVYLIKNFWFKWFGINVRWLILVNTNQQFFLCFCKPDVITLLSCLEK